MKIVAENYLMFHFFREYNRYRLVSATGHKPITVTGDNKYQSHGFEETKASLRKSQVILDDINYEDVKSRNSSSEDLPELSTKKYPYLSNTAYSTYSLPRNHRYVMNFKL